jgi:Tfp pilus assembly protein PilF
MGLVQRNFLDLVEVSSAKLQVALVIDGTDSMGTAIDDIRRALHQMIDDLRRYKDVTFQLVVFRDEGSPSGPVSFPLDTPQRSFTADSDALHAAIESIKPESGAPYFPELIDLGISKALTDLGWSKDADTSRWLLIFSNAPPFDEGFDEPASKASRRFATQQLISTAARLDIKLNCVLCPCRDEDKKSYEQTLAKTRQFMSQLSGDTGGLMLDLSYPDIRKALEKAAQTERVTYQPIGQIRREDIDEARRAEAEQRTLLASNRRLQIAILPHMSLDRLSFDPSLEAVQIAAELRHRFRAIPGAELKSPLAIERQAALLQARGVRGEKLLPALASALNVDYVVWGTVSQSQGNTEVKSAIYDKAKSQDIVADFVRSSSGLPVTELTGQLASSLGNKVRSGNVDLRLAAAFSSVQPNSSADARLVNPVSLTVQGRTNLLAGFEELEKALAYAAGSAEAEPLLNQARKSLEQARSEDQQNPLVYLLLANACFNQSQALSHENKVDDSNAALRECAQALSLAYRFRREAKFSYLRREIEADHALLISKDIPAAIEAYEELCRVTPDTPLHTALRAHWMLAGIYSGDWGVARDEKSKPLVDAVKARNHLIQILAHWQDSSEAAFIRRNLRWDEDTGTNRFEQFPRTNETASGKIVGA